jgi:hypothetical protein
MKKALLISIAVIAIGVLFRILLPNSQPQANSVDKNNASEKNKISKTRKNRLVVRDDSLDYNEPEMVNEIIHNILDKKAGFKQRTKDILALRKMKLTKADEQALIDHLLLPQEDEVYTIKNDIIEHLVRYGSDKRQVGNALLNIMKNADQDRVMREYVLQYVPEYYLSRWHSGLDWDDLDEQDRQKFNSTMWQMTELREGSMAGGALFALYRIADKHEDLNQTKVYDKAHDVLVDSSYMNPNRMGAVQILAFSNKEEYFDTARQIVMKKQGPVLLQVTAMHTAAKSSTTNHEFIKYLTTISSGRLKADPTLRRCAQLTLNKIKR